MILARASRLYLFASLALVSTSANADVLEVSEDGARWVAGGPVAPSSEDELLGSAGAIEIVEGLDVPEVVIADVRAHASDVPAEYAPKIQELAARFDLSPSLLEALVWQESRWREDAVSRAGARGLAQLMPDTATYLGVDPDDPLQNLEGGARYLREQLDRFDGDLEKALAAYNAGPGRVIRADGIPDIRETRQYVAAIMGRLANHSRPELRQ